MAGATRFLDEDGHVVDDIGQLQGSFQGAGPAFKARTGATEGLFDEHDFDDDELEQGELARFARRVIPEATREDVTYFRVMMDADGGEVSPLTGSSSA